MSVAIVSRSVMLVMRDKALEFTERNDTNFNSSTEHIAQNQILQCSVPRMRSISNQCDAFHGVN